MLLPTVGEHRILGIPARHRHLFTVPRLHLCIALWNLYYICGENIISCGSLHLSITEFSHFRLILVLTFKMSPSFDSATVISSQTQRLSVVVTGGASGIGLAITRHFASQGHMVAVLDVNSKTGPGVVAEVSKQYPQAKLSFKWCDVSSWEGQYAVFEQVYREHENRIDIVIANAGISDPIVGALDCTPTEFPRKPNLRMQEINLNGVIYSLLCLSTNPFYSVD